MIKVVACANKSSDCRDLPGRFGAAVVASAISSLLLKRRRPIPTALSHAVVLATVSPDLIDTTKIDRRPFARCFKALGLTENDLKATIKAGTPGPRVKRCFDSLIGL